MFGTIHQFDQRHKRLVAGPVTAFQYAQVSAGPVLEARPEFVEELGHHGPVAQAQFSTNILGVISDPAGTLYVMDAGNRRIRVVTPSGIVSTLFEFTNPDQTPGNIKLDAAGDLYLSDRQHNQIYKVTVQRSR